jgi:hypothetical protein
MEEAGSTDAAWFMTINSTETFEAPDPKTR